MPSQVNRIIEKSETKGESTKNILIGFLLVVIILLLISCASRSHLEMKTSAPKVDKEPITPDVKELSNANFPEQLLASGQKIKPLYLYQVASPLIKEAPTEANLFSASMVSNHVVD